MIVRQGDVILIQTKDSADGLAPVDTDPRGLVLAEGESSGHFHRVFGRGCKLFQRAAAGERLLVVGRDGAELRVVGGGGGGVDRHTPIALAPGNYVIRTQRSWTSESASRAVSD